MCVGGVGRGGGELSRERCSDGATQVFEVFFVTHVAPRLIHHSTPAPP